MISRTKLTDALAANFSANILKHKMNAEVMMSNPLAIHDHTDWMSAIEKEIAQIAEYEDKLAALKKHFGVEE